MTTGHFLNRLSTILDVTLRTGDEVHYPGGLAAVMAADVILPTCTGAGERLFSLLHPLPADTPARRI